MQLAKRCMVLGLAMAMLMAPVSLAQDAAAAKADILKVVPADAWGFLTVRNLEDLNQEFLALARRLNLPFFGPGGVIESPLAAMKAQLGIFGGFDDNGSLAVAILGGEGLDDIDRRMVVFAPSGNVKTLLEPLNAEEAEGGLYRATLMDQQVFVGEKGGFAVVSPHESAVKAAIAGKSAIGEKLTDDERKDFADNDLYLWINLETVVKAARPMIDGFLTMMQGMQAGGSEQAFMQAWSGMGFKQIEQMIDEARAVSLGIDLGPTGLGLDFVFSARPGTELATMMTSVKGSDQSLLVGLPDEDFVIAFATRSSAAANEMGSKQIAQMLDSVAASEDVSADLDKQKFMDFKSKVLAGYQLELVNLSAGLSMLPEGPNGVIGATLVVECRDSARAQVLLGEIVETAKAMVKSEEVREALNVIQHESSAETIDGAKVDHLRIDLDRIPEINADDVGIVKKVIGQDGVLFRVAAADAKRLAITLGGGAGRTETVIGVCKKGAAPLGERAGIKRVNETLPKQRQGEVYIAVDQIVALIKSVAKTVGEDDELPFSLPKIDAPVAVVSSSGTNYGRVDVFLPIELIQAIGQAAMQAMMMGG